MYNNGFIKVAVVTPSVKVSRPMENAIEMIEILNEIEAGMVLFPELSITGYSLEDMFYHTSIMKKSEEAIKYFLDNNTFDGVVVFGAPFEYKGMLYNVAMVAEQGKLLGIIPKMFLPHTGEFYEKRWFADGVDVQFEIEFLGQSVPFGSIVFNSDHYSFGVEVCADMWGPLNPSANLYLSGAEVMLNLSASNEFINKTESRKLLINASTFRHKGAYIYCSAGVNESTGANVFGGDKIVSEMGAIIAHKQDFSFDAEVLYADIDIAYLKHVRRSNGWFKDARKRNKMNVFEVDFTSNEIEFEINRKFDKTPFVPKNNIKEAFDQITSIQTSALLRRLKHINTQKTIVGLSGGLDSTLALIQMVKTYERANYDLKGIIAVSMPSYPTSDRTKNNAKKLAKQLGVTFMEKPIHDIVDSQMLIIDHEKKDVTYENIQARARTNILLNLANKHNGIVIGTGDMTETALGWCTYGGDQFAHYGLNAGIPKTLVRFMVKEYANYLPEVKDCLIDIVNTPISPELLPDQVTEDTIGSYEINDFIMYRYLKFGDSIERIKTFLPDSEEIVDNFFRRFYKNQFKRNTMPEGPKVIFTSLSSHSDFRIASDVFK
ncbi:NAD(+) synthase [Mycoplasmatota bacterium]|nr:NAD(+) synthase [Mycoplasmatota bacterium]